MSIAVKEAKMGLIKNEVPVGTVITYYDKIISSNHNRVILDMDPSAHAEILCIRDATKKLQTLFLNECSLYTTLEPCVMCAQAIAFSKIKRLYFGAAAGVAFFSLYWIPVKKNIVPKNSCLQPTY